MAEIKTVFTLADVVFVTGLKQRTIQLWADAGLLRSLPETDRAGTGKHRRFPWYEVKLACYLAPLCDLQLPIGKLLELHWSMRREREPQPPQHPLINALTVLSYAKERTARLHEISGGVLCRDSNGIFPINPDREAYFVVSS
jgi:hypothetical protein